MRKFVVGFIVALVTYYAVGSMGMNHRFVLLTTVIGFMVGFGMVQTYWSE